MGRIPRALLVGIAIAALLGAAAWFVDAHFAKFPVLDPAGPVALGERTVIFITFLLCGIVVIPVFAMLAFFAWRYHTDNPLSKDEHLSDWDHTRAAEIVCWVIPSIIIVALAFSSLSPQTATSTMKPLAAQVWFEVTDDHLRRTQGWTPLNPLQLFAPDAAWQQGIAHVQVFGVNELTILTASDQDLKIMLDSLRAHHISLAMNAEMMPVGSNGCGSHSEGYSDNPQDLTNAAKRIKALGGDLQYIDMDEPLFYGTLPLSGSCQYTAAQIAQYVGKEMAQLQVTFPNIKVGDSEPIVGTVPPQFHATPEQWIGIIEQWEQIFRNGTGRPLDFFHADITWKDPLSSDTKAWGPPLTQAHEYFASKGVPFGIYYNGDGATSDTQWTGFAAGRFQYIEAQLFTPDQAIIYSWVEYPNSLLPETQDGTLTYLLDQYLKLGTKK